MNLCTCYTIDLFIVVKACAEPALHILYKLITEKWCTSNPQFFRTKFLSLLNQFFSLLDWFLYRDSRIQSAQLFVCSKRKNIRSYTFFEDLEDKFAGERWGDEEMKMLFKSWNKKIVVVTKKISPTFISDITLSFCAGFHKQKDVTRYSLSFKLYTTHN